MKALFVCFPVAGLLLVTPACSDDAGVDGGPDAAPAIDAEPIDDTPRPGKRSDTAGVADPASNSIVIFGGDDGPIVNQIPSASYLGDTWLYEPDVGWTELETATAPSTRGRQAVGYDPATSRMLLFGGRYRLAGTIGDYTLYNDLWEFSFDTETWTMLDDGQGTAPAPRYFATGAYSPTQSAFYVFGGDTNPGALDIDAALDVWAYDENGWREVTTTGQGPTPRLFMSYTYDPQRDRLVAFAGQVGDFVTPSFNDLYALDLATGTWSVLHDGQGTAPDGRFSSGMTYDSARDRYLIFGGHANSGVENDIWAFDPTNDTWTLLNQGDTFTGSGLGCAGNPSEIPADYVVQDLDSPERRTGGVLTMLGDTLWLMAGETDCSDHLDDTWTMTPEGVWTEVIEARSGESCARRNDACVCLCI